MVFVVLGNYLNDDGTPSSYLIKRLSLTLDAYQKFHPNKIIVSGHTPTALIDEAYTGKIIIKNNHIAIDCGIVFGYRLGLICLDTLEEFYVDKID